MAAVRVTVEGALDLGELERIWLGFGYDELNWTATPRGRANMAALREIFGGPAVVRAHNLLTSGNGRALPHWSSGNVYHEDAQGGPVYDWSQADAVFDVWVEHGMVPIVELGFCPVQLSRPSHRAFRPTPSLYGEYESWGWTSVPRDEGRWRDLVHAVAEHFSRRYGAGRTSEWYWEFWNEPDIVYWDGSVEEYCHFYDVTVAGVRRALPRARVGGPATTGNGPAFLERFLEHCVHGAGAPPGQRVGPPDFVSFHTKGAPGFERTYGPIGPGGAAGDQDRSPSTAKMLREIRANLDLVRSYPALADAPVLVDECDPGVPAHMGVFDNRNYQFRNTEYYPVFQLQLMGALLSDQTPGSKGVSLATAWAWYMEGDRYFEGTRSFFTASDIPTPMANAYRMLAMLGHRRLGARVEQTGTGAPEGTVGALSSVNSEGGISAIVWHHNDDQYVRGTKPLELVARDLPCVGRPVQVTHYLLDAEHSNSHTAWLELGGSQHPTPEDVSSIKQRSSLDVVYDERLDPCPGSLSFHVSLRCPAALLVKVTPTGGAIP
jgi:xylan 1,4-beta-xylosidase